MGFLWSILTVWWFYFYWPNKCIVSIFWLRFFKGVHFIGGITGRKEKSAGGNFLWCQSWLCSQQYHTSFSTKYLKYECTQLLNWPHFSCNLLDMLQQNRLFLQSLPVLCVNMLIGQQLASCSEISTTSPSVCGCDEYLMFTHVPLKWSCGISLITDLNPSY